MEKMLSLMFQLYTITLLIGKHKRERLNVQPSLTLCPDLNSTPLTCS